MTGRPAVYTFQIERPCVFDMPYTPFWINLFMLMKLPSAYFTGVRVKSISATECRTTVRHRWINQNPFGSVYFAVLAMAAEASTGLLVMRKIRACGQPISMLVAHNRAQYSKKARGRIVFACTQGELLAQAVERALHTGEGQTVWVQSVGHDAAGDVVATFDFEWTLKGKKP